MPFRIPDLIELANRAARAFRANLKGSDAKLWPNNVAVSSKVIAGHTSETFTFLDYISKQHIKHLAEGPWLERHAYDYGLARLPATYAQGSIIISGDVGISVPAGIEVQRADGVRFVATVGGITNGDGEATLQVRALSPGRAGNTPAGAVVTLTAPMSRLHSNGEVGADGIGAGADVESDEGLRQRLLFRLRNPPHGGAVHDYVAWAREINGVTRVFVDPVTATNGRVSVGVWFLMDGLYQDGIPQGADVQVVADYIETQRPAGALVEVAAPTPSAVNITISGLAGDTLATREAILAELRAMFMRHARVSTLAAPFTLYRSVISEAISIATGEQHHVLTTPNADLAFGAGIIPVLGVVTFA